MFQPSRGRDNSGYLSEDTIAAISTGLSGAVAIVRMSGPQAFSVLETLTDASVARSSDPRKLHRVVLKTEKGVALDDALVTRFVNPNSFSGEDLVEFHTHGGTQVCSGLLETLSRLGVRSALPGEFSFRAIRNGKMTLSQAEATADLIGATNEKAAQLALEKMSGAQNRLTREIAEGLRELATLGEVGIDFSDQDVDEVSLPRLKQRLSGLIERVRKLEAGFSRGSRIQEGISVAFVGLPNAGKSSFFNALLGEDRSIVSEIAGTTRDVVKETLTLRGKQGSVTLRLQDTAGLRDTVSTIERMGIERTQKAAKEADLLILVADPTASIDPVVEEWKKLGSPAEKTLGVISKVDLLGKSEKQLIEFENQMKAFGLGQWLRTSSSSGQGIHEASEAIADFCEKWVHRDAGEILLTRHDHWVAVGEALVHLDRAAQASELDLFASDLRQALHSMGSLIGETVADDILGRIFSNFCIGK